MKRDFKWELYKLREQFKITDEDIKLIKKWTGAKDDRDLVFEIEKLIEQGGIK